MDEDPLALMNDEQTRDQVLEEFNASTLDPVGPLDQTLSLLNEMDELEAGHDDFVKSLLPSVDVT